MRFLVGVDDTDNHESIGTGALARELMGRLERELSATSRGITRHQLYVHPDIPYTSHNSAACLALDCEAGAAPLAAACRALIGQLFHPGADPGLCVAAPERLAHPELADFGRRAQREVLPRARADELSRRHELILEPLGGTGGGVIGALAAAALRAGADDGRFIAWPGARQIAGVLAAGELAARLSLDGVIDGDGAAVGAAEPVETRGWVRPELRGGKVLLVVERDGARWAVIRKKPGEGDI
jgi:hypothetical protein